MTREIPATLRDSLTARLDHLEPAKEVAQVAAVIGSEFSFELLQTAGSIDEPKLQSALDKLVDAELIYARGIAPEATYQFKRALIQDAAYEGLLKTRRRELHLRVAQTIAEHLPSVAEEHPELIARHWTEAGEKERRLAAWKKKLRKPPLSAAHSRKPRKPIGRRSLSSEPFQREVNATRRNWN